MKSFLKKKWHRLPVGIITVILLLCLVTGSAFAAFNFWPATANVTVTEPMTVTLAAINTNTASWDASTNTLTVNLTAGAQTKAGWDVTHTGTGFPITVMPSSSPSSADSGNITLVWKDGPGSGANVIVSPGVTIAPGATQRIGLTVLTSGGTTPGTYTFTLAFNRS